MEYPGKATHQETRAHNESLVLATIYHRGPISRADVARETSLTRTTVSDVVSGLIETGMTHEVGWGPSTGGKAPILLEVPDDARHIIGIDLGEKVFRGAIVNLRGRIVSATEIEVDFSDGETALQRVFQLIDRLVGSTERPIVGIGIGAPGLADTDDGTVLQAVHLDWRELPLGHLVRERYGLPVYVANDSQATALAEHVFGGPRTSNLIVVRAGRGIGAGVILRGELFQGDGYGAGEIGHTAVVDDGPHCRCGSRGCLEVMANSIAILASLQGKIPARGATLQLEDVADACASGNEVALTAVAAAARFLGTALAGLVGALSVRRIVVVGSLAVLGEPWLETVRASVRSRVLPLLAVDTSIEIGRVDADAVVLGASALLLTRELGLLLLPEAKQGAGLAPADNLKATNGRRFVLEEVNLRKSVV
jgi:N-acetylglucosamine repressor